MVRGTARTTIRVMVDDEPLDDPGSAQWKAMLTGEDPSLLKVRRFWRRVPAAPRCKVCASPSHGFGGALARLFWHGPMRDNPLLCKACFGPLSQAPRRRRAGDQRRLRRCPRLDGPRRAHLRGGFRGLIQSYYRSAAVAVDENGGIVDKFLGDGVMALFIPVIAGENHAARAIDGRPGDPGGGGA